MFKPMLFILVLSGFYIMNNSFAINNNLGIKVYNNLSTDNIYLRKGKIKAGTLKIKIGAKKNPIPPNGQHGYMFAKTKIFHLTYTVEGKFSIFKDKVAICSCHYSANRNTFKKISSGGCRSQVNYICAVIVKDSNTLNVNVFSDRRI